MVGVNWQILAKTITFTFFVTWSFLLRPSFLKSFSVFWLPEVVVICCKSTKLVKIHTTPSTFFSFGPFPPKKIWILFKQKTKIFFFEKFNNWKTVDLPGIKYLFGPLNFFWASKKQTKKILRLNLFYPLNFLSMQQKKFKKR